MTYLIQIALVCLFGISLLCISVGWFLPGILRKIVLRFGASILIFWVAAASGSAMISVCKVDCPQCGFVDPGSCTRAEYALQEFGLSLFILPIIISDGIKARVHGFDAVYTRPKYDRDLWGMGVGFFGVLLFHMLLFIVNKENTKRSKKPNLEV